MTKYLTAPRMIKPSKIRIIRKIRGSQWKCHPKHLFKGASGNLIP